MRLTPENKEKVRLRILASAADAFRARGIAAVSLDDVMAGAGLTRGAFYAHFASKDALVAEVLRHDHPLLRMLAARKDQDPAALWRGMRAIFEGYLDPGHLDEVHRGCTLAALTAEAARGGPAQREGYEAGLAAIAAEMCRGLTGAPRDTALAAAVAAAGAVAAARACASDGMRRAILSGARDQVIARLDALKAT